MIFHTAGYGVTMGSLASTAANYMGGVRPDVVAYALMGGGKKRRGKSTGKGKGRGRVARATRRVRRALSPRRSRSRSPRRVARSAARSPRRVARRASTARRDDRRPDVRRRPEVQRIPKGERKERLKQRLSERRTRRSIIKDIESGKPEQARKKMKTLSADPTRQSSMNSFLAGIESGSMPSSLSDSSIRYSDMSSSEAFRHA